MNAEFLIVGAGSAGCAAAHALVTAGHTVVLLEAGEADDASSIRNATSVGRAIIEHDWGFASDPDETRGGRSEPWHRGRVIGGTSSINAMIYVRGTAADYDRWAALGNHGWEAESVMPLFEQMECFDPGGPEAGGPGRGRHGPVHVKLARDAHPLTDAFFRSAAAAGLPFNPDYNGQSQEGIGHTQLTQIEGRRWSAADAFLKPILHDGKLQVISGAHVKKIEFDQGAATGVLFERDGEEQRVTAGQIVLCAGVINTPHLLMLSGVGDAAALQELGIPIVLDRPGVGKGLMEHPSAVLVYQTNVPTHKDPVPCLYEAIGFARTRPEEPEPDVELEFAPAGVDIRTQRLMPDALYVTVKKSYPLSRGRLELVSPDFRTPPAIAPRLLAAEADAETLMRGVGLVREILSKPPIADFITEQVRPDSSCSTVEQVREFIGQDVSISYHSAGTCRMGVDDEAVVTPELKVRGVDNLWIADASIFPHHISGNINAACMMIGTKFGRQFAMNCDV